MGLEQATPDPESLNGGLVDHDSLVGIVARIDARMAGVESDVADVRALVINYGGVQGEQTALLRAVAKSLGIDPALIPSNPPDVTGRLSSLDSKVDIIEADVKETKNAWTKAITNLPEGVKAVGAVATAILALSAAILEVVHLLK